MTAGAHSMISDLKEAVLAAQNCSLAGMKAGQEIAERAAANRIKALEIRLAEMTSAYENAVAQCREQLRELKTLREAMNALPTQ